MEIISNQAQVSFSYEGSMQTKTNSSNIVNSTMKDTYDISVEKTSTTTCFRAGETINYTIRITNIGCGCLGGFTIVDDLSGEDYLTFVEGSGRVFVNGSMSDIVPVQLNPLTFEVDGKLNRDEELILQYSALVNQNISSDVAEITNNVTVNGYPCGCGCRSERQGKHCVSESASLTIVKCEFAEVLITKAVSNDNVCCADELDYLITLTNIGNIDATNVVVTDLLPASFTATEIHMENNGNHYKFETSEYTIDGANLLTLPNETGTAILVPAIAPGVDNTTRIRIHGHM